MPFLGDSLVLTDSDPFGDDFDSSNFLRYVVYADLDSIRVKQRSFCAAITWH